MYFRDTGLLHALMGISSLPELLVHPRCGARRKNAHARKNN
jgi:hypothetical protein